MNEYLEYLRMVKTIQKSLEVFYSIITNPIFGYVIGFLSAIGLIYWQFCKSIANRRLMKIQDALGRIIKERNDGKNGKEDDRTIAMLRNKYRFSLGVTIDRMTNTYDANGNRILNDFLPNFINYKPEKSTNKKEETILKETGDRWNYYKDRIRPVIDDLTQFAFLGWIPSRKMKMLKLVVSFCYSVQSIVELHDAVMDKEEAKAGIVFDEPNRSYFKIVKQEDQVANDWLTELENEYNKLAITWRDIIKLNKLDK